MLHWLYSQKWEIAIIQRCCSLKGAEKFSALTNNVAMLTFDPKNQPRDASLVDTLIELDSEKMMSNFTKHFLGVLYKSVFTFLSKEQQKEIDRVKRESYLTDTFKVVNLLLKYVLVYYDKIDKSILKTMMMRLIQVIMYNVGADGEKEAYHKTELASLGAKAVMSTKIFDPSVEESLIEEGILYDLYRGNAGKPFKNEHYLALFKKAEEIHKASKLVFTKITVNLLQKCNYIVIIPGPMKS